MSERGFELHSDVTLEGEKTNHSTQDLMPSREIYGEVSLRNNRVENIPFHSRQRNIVPRGTSAHSTMDLSTLTRNFESLLPKK